MKIYILFLFAYFFHEAPLQAQNNYIYNGGQSDGFSFYTAEIMINNGIFSGSVNHGFDYSLNANVGILWNGGNDDGWAGGMNNLIDNPILQGGIEDGMAFYQYSQNLNNSIHVGGEDDGFSSYLADNMINALAFNGGSGDGFSSSGISKLIWDGDLSSDWLMADNWNIPIVPTMNHSVCIPNGVPNFPKLIGLLGISLNDVHTYASSEVTIFSGAQITGVEGMKAKVNGKLTVYGNLFIYSSESPQIEVSGNGIIEVKTGGAIRVE